MDDEKQVESAVNATAPSFGDDVLANAGPTEMDDRPAIKDWAPAPAFSFLGAFCWLIFWNIFNMVGAMTTVYMFEPNGTPPAIGFGVPAIAQAILVIFYAAVFYTSYFKEKPVLRSSKAISFMNYFMGGVIFGWCWNSNLKQSHDAKRASKGISHIVVIVFYTLVIVYSTTLMAMTLQLSSFDTGGIETPRQSSEKSSISTPPSSSPQRATPAKQPYHDLANGVRFVLPEGWTSKGFGEDDMPRLTTSPKNGAHVRIAYGKAEIELDSMDEMAASDLEGVLSSKLDECTDEEISWVEIGDNDYWAVTGSGTMSYKDSTIPVFIIQLYHLDDGVLYIFQYADQTGEQLESEYVDDFMSFMESVRF